MTEKIKIPPIEVLTAISPVEVNGELDSPMLHEMVQEYTPFVGDMWDKFLKSPEGELDEKNAARDLATYYLLQTADHLQHYTQDKKTWIERFNTATEELYGEPNRATALGIIAVDNTELSRTTTPTLASNLYSILSESASDSRSYEKEKDSILELRSSLLEYIPEIAVTVEALEDKQYTPAEVRDVFQNILSLLGDKDPAWLEWKITNKPLKTMLSVASASKSIDVPDGRSNVANKSEMLGLAFHEIGVHAMRANNGKKSSDLLASGLPEYNDFEEGLGVIFEYIITGDVPQKSKDRYVDIALAMGVIGDHIMSRSDLMDLALSRENTRAMVNGTTLTDEVKLKKDITSHINRIFRGGNGLPVYDNGKIIEQAVFSKDIAYYQGFEIAHKYITKQIEKGTSSEDIFKFLLKGKFDPTNERHETYLKEIGIETL